MYLKCLIAKANRCQRDIYLAQGFKRGGFYNMAYATSLRHALHITQATKQNIIYIYIYYNVNNIIISACRHQFNSLHSNYLKQQGGAGPGRSCAEVRQDWMLRVGVHIAELGEAI